MKSRAASMPVSCFREPLAPRAFLWPPTFVSSKPLQVSYPEASEFFGIALSRFRPAVEVALQKAAPAVMRIDLGVPRPIHRPGGLCSVLQEDFVDHTHSLRRPNPVAPNSRHSGKFPVFPDNRRREECGIAALAYMTHSGAAALVSATDVKTTSWPALVGR